MMQINGDKMEYYTTNKVSSLFTNTILITFLFRSYKYFTNFELKLMSSLERGVIYKIIPNIHFGCKSSTRANVAWAIFATHI